MFPWPVSFAPESLVKWSKWSQSSKETAWSSWKWWESIKMKENICGKRNVVVKILPAALPTLMCCVWNLHCIATGALIVLFCTYLFTLTQKDKTVPVFFRGSLSWSDADTVSEVNTFNGHNNIVYSDLFTPSSSFTLWLRLWSWHWPLSLLGVRKRTDDPHCIAVAKSQGLLETSFGRILKHNPDTMRNLKYSQTDAYLPDARCVL